MIKVGREREKKKEDVLEAGASNRDPSTCCRLHAPRLMRADLTCRRRLRSLAAPSRHSRLVYNLSNRDPADRDRWNTALHAAQWVHRRDDRVGCSSSLDRGTQVTSFIHSLKVESRICSCFSRKLGSINSGWKKKRRRDYTFVRGNWENWRYSIVLDGY